MSWHRPDKGRQQHDLFGPDGFGDDWEEQPTIRTFARHSDEWQLELDVVDSSIDTDWGRASARQEADEAKRKKEREEQLNLCIKKRREAEATALEQKAEDAAAKKTFAVTEWQRRVKLATDCVALADPVQALKGLYDLSLDVEITKFIDQKKKQEVGQLYTALFDQHELKKSLPTTLKSYLHDRSASSEVDESNSGVDESNSDETTIGGDTVKVDCSDVGGQDDDSEIETGNTTIIVNRLPSNENGDIDESTLKESSSIVDVETNDDSESNFGTSKTVVAISVEARLSTHRNIDAIVGKQINAASRSLQHALEILEGIVEDYGDQLTSKGSCEIQQRISLLQRSVQQIGLSKSKWRETHHPQRVLAERNNVPSSIYKDNN